MNPAELKMIADIKRLQLSNTPAEKIIKRPGNQLWNYAHNPALLAENLCRNVHWYGINGNTTWVWDAGSGGNPTGEALARGQTLQTNCGGFNTTARWIGHNVLGLSTTAFVGAFTGANDHFITAPGTIAIDRNWSGNVRTLNQNFDQLRAYFFKSHSWSRYNATMLDASTNTMNFATKTDLYWCELASTNSPTVMQDGRVFMVTQRFGGHAIPGALPYACVSSKALKKFKHHFPIVATVGPTVTQSFINTLPDTTGNNWQTFVLLSRDHMPIDFRRAVNLP
jgi:hypothetical protein